MNAPIQHTFHIPVMGLAFTIDTPVKVARFGISSVISIVDDILIEHMREYYYKQLGETYVPIAANEQDWRARRITDYLNLVQRIVTGQVEILKRESFEDGGEINKYFELLPHTSPVRQMYDEMKSLTNGERKNRIQEELRNHIRPGAIDANIMTKLDKVNLSKKGDLLGPEFSDALAALRGFAKSELSSSIVFSAGLNQRLYSYIEQFGDFYPDRRGYSKKKITLKVSDYRSSYIQGKILAKKCLWVSEHRIESSLNCGGHVFVTDGYLLGPILEEFKAKKQELTEELHQIYSQALRAKGYQPPAQPREVRITVQGGIGTAKENKFLHEYYGVDSTGWGSPFLLVPEVTQLDDETRHMLASLGEKDFYLSDVSPLGIPFNNLRGSSSEVQKLQRARQGRPGSPCTKKFLVSNTEFTDKPICVASRQYQDLKLKQLEEMNLAPEEYRVQYEKVIEKECLCEGLSAPALINCETEPLKHKEAVAVCPGPNLAYFSKITTLKDMVDHIYGRIDLLCSDERPHMFVKELSLYVEYLKKEISKCAQPIAEKQMKYFNTFTQNLLDGIGYYKQMIDRMTIESEECKERIIVALSSFEEVLLDLQVVAV